MKRTTLDTGLPAKPTSNGLLNQASLYLSDDGKTAVVSRGQGTDGNNVRVFDLADSRPLGSLEHKDDFPLALAISPDGSLLATPNRRFEDTVSLIDARTGEIARGLTSKDKGGTKVHGVACAFSPDGRTIYAATHPGDLIGWDVRTSERVLFWEKKFGGSLTKLRVTRDGAKLVTVGADLFTITIWDLATGNKVRSRTGETGAGGLTTLAISPDGKTLAAACTGHNGVAFQWDFNSGYPLLKAPIKMEHRGCDSFFLRKSRMLFLYDTSGVSNRVLIYDAEAGNYSQEWADPAFAGIKAAAATPDGSVLAVYDLGGKLSVYDVRE